MVLQDDRTSVPLPPNLYLLNQNQKFMKRTLHLTVMMLLAIIASVNKAHGQDQVHVVNSVAEAKLLNDGDSVRLVVNGAICADNWEGIIRDNTGAIQTDGQELTYTVPTHKWPLPVFEYGYTYNGCFSGRISKANPYCTKIYNLTYEGAIDQDTYTGEPVWKYITEEEYWDNVGDVVVIEGTDLLYRDWPYGQYFHRGTDPFVVKGKALLKGHITPFNDGRPIITVREHYPIITTIHDEDSGLADFEYYNLQPQEWGDGNLQDLLVKRNFEANKWYTYCLPDGVSTYGNTTVALFESAQDGVLNFKLATGYVPPFTPCLVRFPIEKTEFLTSANPTFPNDTICIVEGGDYNFVGVVNLTQPKDGSYYLTEGNTIKRLASGGTIKPFRAYFEPATPSSARARAISIDGMTTAIEDIEWGDGNPFMVPTDNRIYNLEGQMVGNDLEQLPKGLYIVNGKKVIK